MFSEGKGGKKGKKENKENIHSFWSGIPTSYQREFDQKARQPILQPLNLFTKAKVSLHNRVVLISELPEI